jgi:hypothetical protein
MQRARAGGSTLPTASATGTKSSIATTRVDWPAATSYASLHTSRAQRYPLAGVILTQRDPEAWFRSTQATIFPRATPPVFTHHNAEVRRTIAPERLLVYEVAQGWETLCRFLDVPVPTTPMPITNTAAEFGKHLGPRLNGDTGR